MSQMNQSPQANVLKQVPPGSPSWISPELISSTIDAWQPYYGEPLTDEDALEILTNVGLLYEVLEERK